MESTESLDEIVISLLSIAEQSGQVGVRYGGVYARELREEKRTGFTDPTDPRLMALVPIDVEVTREFYRYLSDHDADGLWTFSRTGMYNIILHIAPSRLAGQMIRAFEEMFPMHAFVRTIDPHENPLRDSRQMIAHLTAIPSRGG